jgi:protein gp37
VFCASLADVWDNRVPQAWRQDLFNLIGVTRELDWLLLTKRPENIEKMLPGAVGAVGMAQWPWPNVWLGTTAEDQAHYDRRWPILCKIPAVVRFISYEPAIGPLSLAGYEYTPDWLICGGESGHGARQMDLAWARAIRDECAARGADFFFKQTTGKGPIPDDLMVRQFPGDVRR